MSEVYLIENGQFKKLFSTEAGPFPGDLIRRGKKFYRVLFRVVEAKADDNSVDYIAEEFNPLNP
jgi:hypothetical protein